PRGEAARREPRPTPRRPRRDSERARSRARPGALRGPPAAMVQAATISGPPPCAALAQRPTLETTGRPGPGGGVLDSPEQDLLVEGLGEELGSSRFHRAARLRH